MPEEKTILGAQAALEALLPQQQRRVVLATSESDEYGTETDEGSWSSEEMSGEEVEVVKSGGGNAPQRPKEQELQPEQHPQAPLPQAPPPQAPLPQAPQAPPQAPQRVVSHLPVNDAARHKHLPTHPPHAQQNNKRTQSTRNTRRQMLNQAKAQAQSIEQAVLEAQRQREMFAKIPPSQNLARTTSVGLLTQLMNPDPQIFPPNHPYRRGSSSGEIRGSPSQGLGQGRFPTTLAMTGTTRPGPPNMDPSQAKPAQPPPAQRPPPTPRQGQEQGQGTLAPPVVAPPEVKRHVSAPQQQQHVGAAPGLILAPGLKPSKSAAAGPVASQVQVGSVVPSSDGSGENGVWGLGDMGRHHHHRTPVHDSARPSGGYRPRARPQDAELEEDSGSEEENSIQLSKSVAQEKLRALAERRGIRPNRRASTDDGHYGGVPAWAQQPEPQYQRQHQQDQHQHLQHMRPPPGPVRMHSSPAPIPQGLTHPYNLPLTALPTTPRTTRRHMLQTEMSESLRRNLLWERQVSKNNILGFRRTASSGGGARGNALNGLRPLTTTANEPPNIVHLSAKGSKNNVNGNQNNVAGGPSQLGVMGPVAEEPSMRPFARNRSWAADDYHYAGW